MNKTTHKRKRIAEIIVSVLLLVAALIYINLTYRTYTDFVKTYYTVNNNKIEEAITVAHLSDLHSVQFGEDNSRLVSAIKEENPDIIAMTGDMFSRRDKKYDSTLSLIRKLKEIAPVYYSFGNHELSYCKYNSGVSISEIRADLESAGVTVLNLEYSDITVKGTNIRIGGAYGFLIPSEEKFESLQKEGYLRKHLWEEVSENGRLPVFAANFQATDSFKLLLSHRFEGFMLWGELEDYDIDLTLSGHVHGGQVVLPYFGALFGQVEGFFPKYTRGLFTENGHSLVLSAGLGNHGPVPRINNPGELVIITLAPEKE